MPLIIKPTHKIITDYYRKIQQAKSTNQLHEGAVAPLFAQLLRHCLGQFPHLELVEQYALKRDGRKPLRVDGAIVDKQTNVLLYGIWEAKDSKDQLESEAQAKFAVGYSNDNILFQSPEQLIIYQQGVKKFDASIADNPQRLINGLELFLNYEPPAYAQWEQAVVAFKGTVGELGQALVGIILTQLGINQQFSIKFAHFSALCRQAINPNLAPAAIIEMLVQHLLTERLFRTIFNNPDFINRNVIAREIETVINSLTSSSFSRPELLANLDQFYQSIEKTARIIHSYSRKQDFLNSIYEQFFQGFAVKVADTHGIVYTPQPIVEFMVNSVQEILRREFNEELINPGVHILDPFTGTGNFILRIMQEITANIHDLELKTKFYHKYTQELHCNEILLLPYYIASMNIEHGYYSYANQYLPFPGICLVDTFELAEPKQAEFMFVEENTERVAMQRNAPIFVIIGNPPYNVGQQNENDDNKNRRYPHIDSVVAATYAKQSQATNKNSLSDAYVKAFAWATERLRDQDKGIIAFVTNNGFLDGIAADGMRKQLGASFSKIYILDLGGNSRKTDDDLGNVFGIRVGVAITILVKNGSSPANIYYARVDKGLKKSAKLEFLETTHHIFNLALQPIIPNSDYTWLSAGLETDFATFTPLGSKEGKAANTNQLQEVIFKLYGRGVATSRDAWAYNFDSTKLATNMRSCIDFYNEHVFRCSRLHPKPDIDGFVTYDDKKLSWSESLKINLQRGKFTEFLESNIRGSLYRPFTKQQLYFCKVFNERVYQFPKIFPTPATEQENQIICVPSAGSKQVVFFIANTIIDLNFFAGSTPNQCFPFYTYLPDGTNRQENLTGWALQTYQTHYQDPSIDKWAIFYYIYGLLHHQGYRTKYAANLKRELPRIPYAQAFWNLSHAGRKLAELHLNYETQAEYPLLATISGHLEWRVTKMRLSKDKTSIIYNDSLTLSGIPTDALDYRLGNRSALEWIIDQYQVSTDKRSGIVNDPNRRDDEGYIVRLLKQIITVSLETVRLVTAINAEAL